MATYEANGIGCKTAEEKRLVLARERAAVDAYEAGQAVMRARYVTRAPAAQLRELEADQASAKARLLAAIAALSAHDAA